MQRVLQISSSGPKKRGQGSGGPPHQKPVQWPAAGPWGPTSLSATPPSPICPSFSSCVKEQVRTSREEKMITPVLEDEDVDPSRLLEEEHPRGWVKHQAQSRWSMYGTFYQQHRLRAWHQRKNSIDNECFPLHLYTEQSHRRWCKYWFPSTCFLCDLKKLRPLDIFTSKMWLSPTSLGVLVEIP